VLDSQNARNIDRHARLFQGLTPGCVHQSLAGLDATCGKVKKLAMLALMYKQEPVAQPDYDQSEEVGW
jgi:hypothetical protein